MFVQPLILGHEGVGIVEAAGEAAAKRFKSGEYVVLSLAYCGTCTLCQDGKPAYCSTSFDCNFKGTRTSDNSHVARAETDDLALHAQFFGQSAMSTRAVVRMECAIKTDAKDVNELESYAGLGCGFQTGCGGTHLVCRIHYYRV